MNNINKILILRFGAIGDVVHSTALFRSIKEKYPHVSIHYAAFRAPAANIQNDPDLDKVWIIEGKSYKQLWKLAKELKKENFDAFINLQPGIRTRIFSLMLGMPRTITYRKTFKLHAVENFWQTGKKLFKDLELPKKLHIYIKEEIKNKAAGMLDKKGMVIAFNMGVSFTRQGRRWPQEYWRELAKKLLEKYECEIILTGSQDDKEFSEALLDISPKVRSFCGKVSIEENTALLSLCDLVISGDTGPLHIATAVGVPAIGLYGAAPVSRTGPYGLNYTALYSDKECVPCNRRKCKYLKQNEIYTPCLMDIMPEQVLKTTAKLLLEKI
ncbi:MAG: hypothetical protein A2Y25_02445 [Candidatus Melainabacteria bacterium GWF2_37_15]|nr:MAG: hypothetical protein A2Y25_02445 [Candidatus Melainabacteria bacterium GWF2_37_15]